MRRRKFKNLYRGDVVYVDLGQHPNSSVQSGNRPCIVVSNNKSNQCSEVINVLPCTGKIKDNPVHIRVMPSDVNGYFERESDILAEQIITIGEKQIISKVGCIPLNSEISHLINRAMIKQLSLEDELRLIAMELIREGKFSAEKSEPEEIC